MRNSRQATPCSAANAAARRPDRKRAITLMSSRRASEPARPPSRPPNAPACPPAALRSCAAGPAAQPRKTRAVQARRAIHASASNRPNCQRRTGCVRCHHGRLAAMSGGASSGRARNSRPSRASRTRFTVPDVDRRYSAHSPAASIHSEIVEIRDDRLPATACPPPVALTGSPAGSALVACRPAARRPRHHHAPAPAAAKDATSARANRASPRRLPRSPPPVDPETTTARSGHCPHPPCAVSRTECGPGARFWASGTVRELLSGS